MCGAGTRRIGFSDILVGCCWYCIACLCGDGLRDANLPLLPSCVGDFERTGTGTVAGGGDGTTPPVSMWIVSPTTGGLVPVAPTCRLKSSGTGGRACATIVGTFVVSKAVVSVIGCSVVSVPVLLFLVGTFNLSDLFATIVGRFVVSNAIESVIIGRSGGKVAGLLFLLGTFSRSDFFADLGEATGKDEPLPCASSNTSCGTVGNRLATVSFLSLFSETLPGA